MKKSFVSSLMFFVAMGVTFAAEHSGGGHELSQVLGKIVNSTILWGSLAYILYKPISSYFKNRASEEKAVYETAEKEKKEAEENLKKVLARVDNLKKELDEIKGRFEREAEKDKKMIERKIEEEIAKIKRFSELEIERIYNEKLREIKMFALDISIKEAEEKIKKRLDKGTQQAIIRRFLKEIERVN